MLFAELHAVAVARTASEPYVMPGTVSADIPIAFLVVSGSRR
ncbi:hypothetical protein [Saccharothrix xinjiangensis]|uniref:AraC family transcriptional regulator n=1 Tax=Saccharothrix xinjiangensis TaxID=204798 RepID=A0ABV9XYJ1_9PSEU